MQRKSTNNWSNYLEFAKRFVSDDISDQLRKNWVDALLFLERELGDNYIENCQLDHPIFVAINNTTHGGTWAIDTLITIYKTLQELKNKTITYSKLRGKLLSPTKYKTEMIPFIEISELYMKAGFEINFLEENSSQKTPDIEVVHTANNEKFFIEVSKLNDNETVKDSILSYSELCNQLSLLDIPYSCNQLRNFHGSEVNEVVKNILLQREKAIHLNEIIHYKDDYITLTIAPQSKFAEFNLWLDDNDRRKGHHGISLNFNETRRIADYKIPLKSKQIPIGSTGIIYLPVNSIYFWVLDVQNAVIKFQDALRKHPNILGVVIYSNVLDPNESFSCVQDDFVLTNKMINTGVLRKTLFVLNPTYDYSLTSEVIKKIYSTFI